MRSGNTTVGWSGGADGVASEEKLDVEGASADGTFDLEEESGEEGGVSPATTIHAK